MKIRFPFWLVISLFWGTILVAELSYSQVSNLGEIYQQGNSLLEAKKWAEAAEVYAKGLESYPEEAWLYVNLGWAYRNIGEYSKALEVTLKGYELKPDEERIALNLKGAYFDLGGSYFDDENWEDALTLYKQASETFPDEAWFYVNMARVYRNLKKDLTLALDLTLKGVKLKPDDVNIVANLRGAYFDLGRQYGDSSNWEKASGVYREALERFPNEAWFYVNLGWAYRNLKEYSKALEVTLKGFELKPDDEKIALNLKGTYFELGNSYSDSSRWEDAAAIYKVGSQTFPEEAWFYVNLGWAYRNLKRYEEGLKITLKGHELNPGEKRIGDNLKGAYYDLGKLHLDNEDWEKAKTVYLEASRTFPDEAWFYGNLSWVYRNLDENYKSLEVSKKAYELKKNEEQIKENLRWSYIALGEHYRYGEKNPAKSIPLYQEALDILPDDLFLYERLGWAYIASRRREEAIEGGYFVKSAQLYFKGIEVQEKVILSLPFKGKWMVPQGNYGDFSHFGLGSFAWDFMKVSEDYRNHQKVEGRGLVNEDFYSFGSEILAPAAGMVIEVVNDDEDNLYGVWNYTSLGNYVKIDHGDGIASGLFHLLKGSIVVKVGDRVERGGLLGQVGNSGYTDTPHLHFNLYDSNGATIPTEFYNYGRREESGNEGNVIKGVPQKGEVVWKNE